MTDAFRKLLAYEKKENLQDDLPQAFNSHPAMQKRIARLEKKWKKLNGKAEFSNLTALQNSLRLAAGK